MEYSNSPNPNAAGFMGAPPTPQNDDKDLTLQEKSRRNHVMPVTAHLLNQNTEDGPCKIFGIEPTHVCIIGVILSVRQEKQSCSFSVNDSTGDVQCRLWLDGKDGEDNLPIPECIAEGQRVKVFGAAKIHNGNAQLSCPPVASVSVVSTNAITLHMMEVIHASHIIQDAPEITMPLKVQKPNPNAAPSYGQQANIGNQPPTYGSNQGGFGQQSNFGGQQQGGFANQNQGYGQQQPQQSYGQQQNSYNGGFNQQNNMHQNQGGFGGYNQPQQNNGGYQQQQQQQYNAPPQKQAYGNQYNQPQQSYNAPQQGYGQQFNQGYQQNSGFGQPMQGNNSDNQLMQQCTDVLKSQSRPMSVESISQVINADPNQIRELFQMISSTSGEVFVEDEEQQLWSHI